MKTMQQVLSEAMVARHKKRLVILVDDFNPPAPSDLSLLLKVRSDVGPHGDLEIFGTDKEDKIENVLGNNTKMLFMRKMFPKFSEHINLGDVDLFEYIKRKIGILPQEESVVDGKMTGIHRDWKEKPPQFDEVYVFTEERKHHALDRLQALFHKLDIPVDVIARYHEKEPYYGNYYEIREIETEEIKKIVNKNIATSKYLTSALMRECVRRRLKLEFERAYSEFLDVDDNKELYTLLSEKILPSGMEVKEEFLYETRKSYVVRDEDGKIKKLSKALYETNETHAFRKTQFLDRRGQVSHADANNVRRRHQDIARSLAQSVGLNPDGDEYDLDHGVLTNSQNGEKTMLVVIKELQKNYRTPTGFDHKKYFLDKIKQRTGVGGDPETWNDGQKARIRKDMARWYVQRGVNRGHHHDRLNGVREAYDPMREDSDDFGVLYHGTSAESAKNIMKIGVRMGFSHKGYFGRGFYCAGDPELAKTYAEEDDIESGIILRVELSDTSKILDLRKESDWARWRDGKYSDKIHQDNFNQIAVHDGIDGLYDRSFGGVIVYNPKIIKRISKYETFTEETEKENPNHYNVIVLAGKGKYDDSLKSYPDWPREVGRLAEEAKKLGIPVYLVDTVRAWIEKDDNDFRIHNLDDNKGHKILRGKTVVFTKSSAGSSKNGRNILQRLEELGCFVINTLNCMLICGDKYTTYLKLEDANIPTPRTAMVPRGLNPEKEDMNKIIKTIHSRVGGNFPVVLKTTSGSKGRGVMIVESWKGLISTIQALQASSPAVELMLQEYHEIDGDYRTHVFGDEIKFVMKRKKVENDFRSNYSLGGEVVPVPIEKFSDEEREMCLRAAGAVRGKWVGVDLMRDQRTKKLYIIEVNATPGIEGIEKIYPQFTEELMKWAFDKNNWKEFGVIGGEVKKIKNENT